ncbi:MAG: phosphate acyltransferase PlsX [Candidatus Omnitrophica bacterium]|nr:phosphate acyltransferase PlsX [Candidatus Omnitrophota bacterium]MBU4477482.1 phosphate acyltransferase PlsX [Candidatus Omnitrophota bacterium]MCG2704286.1 phosphate acyltransferase PlsX [Candidatus Omnitrophota bacterium]
MRIAVDAMGGDHAPDVVVHGVLLAASEIKEEIILVGPKDIIESKLSAAKNVPPNISIINATEFIAMDESPAVSVRRKKDSSINVAVKMVKEKKADAIVSAGNTGAVVCAASLFLKNLPGIDRPGISVFLPTLKGVVQVIDMGANIDAKPEHLMHYGLMGSIYSSFVLNKENPRVGLLNIGEEETKGPEFVKETFKLLEMNKNINFIGNVEGRDIYTGECDVIVCDGFLGNVVLKVSEGLADAIKEMLRRKLSSNLITRFGAFLSAPAFKALKKEIDYAEYGGAPLLGIDGVCIIAHGGSSANAIKNAIRVARESLLQNVNQHIVEAIANEKV